MLCLISLFGQKNIYEGVDYDDYYGKLIDQIGRYQAGLRCIPNACCSLAHLARLNKPYCFQDPENLLGLFFTMVRLSLH
jgi:hypothetical protein